MRHVFVSYSSADAPTARLVADACQSAGVETFLDERSLEPAGNWYQELSARLAQTDIVFLIVSDTSLQSRYVNQEIGMARQAGARVVPLLLRDPYGLPPEIGSLHGAVLRGKDAAQINECIRELLRANERSAIDIPNALKRKLDEDPKSSKPFLASLTATLDAPTYMELPLIPELREHGPRHVERLLDLCVWMLDDSSIQRLTYLDAVSLIAAVVLRERILYMPVRALVQLIDREDATRTTPLGDVPLRTLWQSWALRAHFDSRRPLRSDFDHRSLLDLDPADADALQEAGGHWMGRFVSEHLGRLAYEAGLAPPSGFELPAMFIAALPGRLRQIVPLLSRAPDIGLRAVARCIDPRDPRPRNVGGAHPLVLAGLLRCAATVDVYARRMNDGLTRKDAPSAIGSVPAAAIDDIDEIRYDPLTDSRTITVAASPRSAFAYQALVDWTRQIQRRLDETWAVFGDVFGEGKFSLRLRTAITPLADEADFMSERRLTFDPKLAQLSTASPELIRLLTAPLYGDKPEVGIREMLQNAIDAVRERSVWSADIGSAPATESYALLDAHSADVLIMVAAREACSEDELSDIPKDWQYWLEVTDRGVGMTPDTVRDYFLRAGATLRQSAEWLRRFSTDQRANLLRSGRFGIGTLACFLLGEEMHVATRHITEQAGLGTYFTARLDEEPIELQRQPAPIGTRLRIPLSLAVFESVQKGAKSWDWYALANPRVVRVLRAPEMAATLAPELSETEVSLRALPWHEVKVAGFDRVLWRPGASSAYRRLWCNGLFIESVHQTYYVRVKAFATWGLSSADVMVFDSNATLPLTVTRDRLAREAPYKAALDRDILLDHCAWLLWQSSLPPTHPVPRAPMWERYHGMSPGDGSLIAPPYVRVIDGLVPWTSWHLGTSGIQVVIAYAGREAVAVTPDDLEQQRAFAQIDLQIFGGFGSEPRLGVAIRELREFVEQVVPTKHFALLTTTEGEAPALPVSNGLLPAPWRGTGIDLRAPEIKAMLETAMQLEATRGAHLVGFFTISSHPTKIREDELTELWRELELPALIPSDPTARANSCKKALDLLQSRIHAYENWTKPTR